MNNDKNTLGIPKNRNYGKGLYPQIQIICGEKLSDIQNMVNDFIIREMSQPHKQLIDIKFHEGFACIIYYKWIDRKEYLNGGKND